ncbi:MAG: sterol desaturase family protein [Mariprofundales bacterium]
MTEETLLRLTLFIAIFTTVALWERLVPRRNEPMNRPQRWRSNLLLVVIDSLLVRLLIPIGAAGFAAQQQWGLLHHIALPHLLEIALAVVVLDGIIYWQHRLFHRTPLLWQLHRVHHADTHLDVSSALRFHPIEILLSMVIKITAVVALGIDPVAVLIFEVLLNGMAMFNHGNIHLPQAVDHWLRMWVVTPDMHRIHHSTLPQEFNRNFGFNLSCWDRMFGSYCNLPQAGQLQMQIGLAEWRDRRTAELGWMLWLPWRGE